jgi:fido (protein-threonine AMPylation protein)
MRELVLPIPVLDTQDQHKQSEREINLEHALKVGVFFAEFLKIHPFKDGNGRTARLLLLKGFAIVPFSL